MKNPQSIVVKDFKRKLLELWNLGFDAKRIKKYFEDNRETWSDINLSPKNIVTSFGTER